MESSDVAGSSVTPAPTGQSMIGTKPKSQAEQRHERATRDAQDLIINSHVRTILKEKPDDIQAFFEKNNKSLLDIYKAIKERNVEHEEALAKLSQCIECIERNEKETVFDGA